MRYHLKDYKVLNGRHERKFVVPEGYHNSIENLIKLIHGQFSEIYVPRFVNNIYFDSLNFKDYSETINGISNR